MKKILLTGGLGYIGSHFVENFSNIFKFSVLDTNYFHHKYKENQLFELTRIKDIRDILQEDMNNIKISKDTTGKKFRKNSFIYDFVSSLRQKINDPLGKRAKKRKEISQR